jgi:hypothetical protein
MVGQVVLVVAQEQNPLLMEVENQVLIKVQVMLVQLLEVEALAGQIVMVFKVDALKDTQGL